LVVPEVQVVDREWVESYVVRAEELFFDGVARGGGGGEGGGAAGGDNDDDDDQASALCRALKYNPKEVSAVRWMGLEELRDACRAHPEQYTQWLREEGELLGWFLGGGGGEAAAAAAAR
jgi:hypothetical protein